MRVASHFFTIFALGLLLGLVGPAQAHITYNPANGHCYELLIKPGNWTAPEAKAAAEARDVNGVKGHLATITSKDENDFLEAHVHLRGVLIGGYQDATAPDYKEPRGGWRWVTGEPWGFENWNEGEPNGGPESNVIHLWGNGRWNDTAHGDKFSGCLVEYDTSKPDPAPKGLSPEEEVDQFLGKVRERYRAYRTYSETVDLGMVIQDMTLAAARAEFSFQRPGTIRVVGNGPEGKVTAVSDGRSFFLFDRDEPTSYVLKAMPPLEDALTEAFQVLSTAYRAPITAMLLADPRPTAPAATRVKGLKMGELVLSDPPIQVVRWDQKVKLEDAPPVDATAALGISTKDFSVSTLEMKFRIEFEDVILRERHTSVEVNPTFDAAHFGARIPPNAERVRSLRTNPYALPEFILR